MSHIPSSAMPHAAPSENSPENADKASPTLSDRAGKLADKARDNPKTAIAAGAAVVAGAIAAAAIPIVRARKKSSDKTGTGKAGKKSGN